MSWLIRWFSRAKPLGLNIWCIGKFKVYWHHTFFSLLCTTCTRTTNCVLALLLIDEKQNPRVEVVMKFLFKVRKWVTKHQRDHPFYREVCKTRIYKKFSPLIHQQRSRLSLHYRKSEFSSAESMHLMIY